MRCALVVSALAFQPPAAGQARQPVDKAVAIPTPADDTLWYDIRQVDIEGKGWQDTEHSVVGLFK